MAPAKGLRPKVVHRANLMAMDGSVSPLCARTPRAIDLRTATWTLVDAMVTCRKCRAALAKQKAAA